MSAVNATIPQQPNQTTPEARSSEPSMEDILASIRRIISDDQSRSAVLTGAVNRRIAAPMPASTPTQQPEHQPSPDEPEAERPAIAPAVAAEPRRDRLMAAGPGDAQPPHLNPPTRSALPDYAHDPAVIEEIANAGVASILRPRPALSETVEDLVPAPEATIEKDPEAEDFADWTEAAEEAEPLLSEQVGASVNSSFQALATTVLMQHTDMIEQMMRDMLRPMLKTWLDDNLPTIVERLVRAEIERVARGGRG